MGYTTHAQCDLVGLGMSAISHIGDTFSQNPRDLAGWEVALDQGRLPVWRGRTLDDDDVLRAEVIQQLMCQGSIDMAAIGGRHEIDFNVYFADCAGEAATAGGRRSRHDRRKSHHGDFWRAAPIAYDRDVLRRYLTDSTAAARPAALLRA